MYIYRIRDYNFIIRIVSYIRSLKKDGRKREEKQINILFNEF